MFDYARRAYHLYNFLRGIETMRWSKILGAAEAQGHLAENVPRMGYGGDGGTAFSSVSMNAFHPPMDFK
jgi:hypothetical protein